VTEFVGDYAGYCALYNKTGKVTHTSKQVDVATVVVMGSWCPKIDVEDEEGARDGQEKMLSLLVRV
jgi:hypothetical protein